MKIKITTSLLFVLLFFNTSFSQSVFPDHNDNQIWEYVVWHFWGGWCENRFVKTGEQVDLCDKQFIEVFDCDEDEAYCYLMGYYRVEDEQVITRKVEIYYDGENWQDTVYCDGPEGLMYDFGVALGDTLTCTLAYPTPQTDFWNIAQNTIDYEGISRYTLNMDFNPYPNMTEIIFNMNWIEGIGSDIHPFYSFACIGDHCEQELQLTKVYRNDVLIYQDSILTFSFPCTNVTTATTEIETDIFKNTLVYPNPVQDKLTIKMDESLALPIDIKIVDLLGNQISTCTLFQHQVTISVDNISSGIYLLETKNITGNKTHKLIKK